MLARWAKVVERWPSSTSAIGPLAALDVVEEVAGGLLVEVAVGGLDDLGLAPGLGVLELAAALGDDLVAAIVGIDRPERAPQLDLGASAQHRLAVGLEEAELA